MFGLCGFILPSDYIMRLYRRIVKGFCSLFVIKSLVIWDALERFRACKIAILSVCVLVVSAVVRVCESVRGVSECAAVGY